MKIKNIYIYISGSLSCILLNQIKYLAIKKKRCTCLFLKELGLKPKIMVGVRLTKSVCHAFFSDKPLLKTPPEAGRCVAKPKTAGLDFQAQFCKRCIIFFFASFLRKGTQSSLYVLSREFNLFKHLSCDTVTSKIPSLSSRDLLTNFDSSRAK